MEGLSLAYNDHDEVVCTCMSITRGEILESISKGAESIDAVGADIDAGVVCESCHAQIQRMIDG